MSFLGNYVFSKLALKMLLCIYCKFPLCSFRFLFYISIFKIIFFAHNYSIRCLRIKSYFTLNINYVLLLYQYLEFSVYSLYLVLVQLNIQTLHILIRNQIVVLLCDMHVKKTYNGTRNYWIYIECNDCCTPQTMIRSESLNDTWLNPDMIIH